MTWESLLSDLAARVGIESSYTDVRGRRIDAPLDVRAAVLASLGYDLSSESSLSAAVLAIEEKSWRRPVAPWVVRTVDAAEIDLDLFLPAGDHGRHWSWDIAFECGGSERGEFCRNELPLHGARDVDGRRVEHRRLALGRLGPAGYHRLRILGESEAEATLVFAPKRCYLPPALDSPQSRAWGLSTHLYALRSKQDWGVGNFGDLGRLCGMTGEAGGSLVATNPFHALFPRRPAEASPYSPCSRLFLNPIYIDVAAVPGFRHCEQAHPPAAALSALRDARLVDYPAVWSIKLRALDALFTEFWLRGNGGGDRSAELAAFRAFIAEGGHALRRFAAFSVFDELHSDEHGRPLPWTDWPPACRMPEAGMIDRAATEHPHRFVFHQYLQFVADRQMEQAAVEGRRAGMALGIMRDLALGVSPDGADIWMDRDAFASSLRCGAPPDDFHPQGQEWGVVPFDPLALRRDYSPFVAALRANMRHAGGLRIDHVAGLARLFVVPLGEKPDRGCYVRYPCEELLALLALESRRNACLVLGEDLGTIPEGFRDRIRAKGVFGCALLYFERDSEGRFRGPGEYSGQSVVGVATHDLPTLAGYWGGRDIAVRLRVGILSAADGEAAFACRADDRRRLVEALTAAGFPLSASEDGSTGNWQQLTDAVHRFLSASPARVLLAQLDDLLGEADQINVPGTVATYPNWRRRVSRDLAAPALFEAIARLAALCREQGRGTTR